MREGMANQRRRSPSAGSGWSGALAAASLAVAGTACDLPPGIRTLDPGEAEPVPPGIAEVQAPPTDDPWQTDFLAWQPGGEVTCPAAPVGGAPGGGAAGGGAVGTPGVGPGVGGQTPFVVEIWDGLADACTDTPDSGARSIRLSFSDLVPGSFTVAQTCVGPLSAGGIFRRFLGTQEVRRAAIDGTVTITAIDDDDVVDGTFSVRFEGDEALTSGGFRAQLGCVSPGR